jgi:hypothetical protein
MVLFAAAALAFGGQAMADGFNYNYIQGDVISSELRGGGSSTSGDGLGAGASVELGSSWTTFFGVERTKYSEAGETIKFTPTSVGIGFHAPLASTLDFVGTASYERVRQGGR